MNEDKLNFYIHRKMVIKCARHSTQWKSTDNVSLRTIDLRLKADFKCSDVQRYSIINYTDSWNPMQKAVNCAASMHAYI